MTKARLLVEKGGWRTSLQHRVFRCCLALVLVRLAVPSVALATEPRLVLIRAKAQDKELWALCARHMTSNVNNACYSPSGERWASSPLFLPWRDWSGGLKAISATPLIEVFDVPQPRGARGATVPFSKQVQFLLEDRRSRPEDKGLHDRESLATRAKRRSEVWDLRRRVETFPVERERELEALTWRLVVSAVLLVVTPFSLLGLTRWLVGAFPVGWSRQQREIEDTRKRLKDIEERLCSWMQDSKEMPRNAEGKDPVLDKLDLALDRLRWLRAELRRVLGFDIGLTNLSAELSGRIAELGESSTLDGLFNELRQLRRLRDELYKYEPAASEEGLSSWVGRVAKRLEQDKKVSDEIRKLDSTDPSEALGHFQSLRAEAQSFEPGGSTTLSQLPAILQGVRGELWKLGKIASIDLTKPIKDQLVELCDKWNERSEELKQLWEQIRNNELERRRLHGIAQSIADTFMTHKPAIDQQLVGRVSEVMSERLSASQALQSWMSPPNLRLDEMAAELSRQLAGLEEAFFPQQEGQDVHPWHQRLEQRLREAAIAQSVSSAYLGLGPLPDPWAVLAREIEQPHRALRLALLAALERSRSIGNHPAARKLFELLHLGEILDRVARFVADLETWPYPDDLWNQGLCPAFGNQWLHDLLRAELILDTYYAATEISHHFGPVRALADAFRGATNTIDRPVLPVGLLAPPEPTWTRLPKVSGLIQLPEVRQQVRDRSQRGAEFVVDVERFALPGQKWLEECHVILFNPADWDPSQERRA